MDWCQSPDMGWTQRSGRRCSLLRRFYTEQDGRPRSVKIAASFLEIISYHSAGVFTFGLESTIVLVAELTLGKPVSSFQVPCLFSLSGNADEAAKGMQRQLPADSSKVLCTLS